MFQTVVRRKLWCSDLSCARIGKIHSSTKVDNGFQTALPVPIKNGEIRLFLFLSGVDFGAERITSRF